MNRRFFFKIIAALAAGLGFKPKPSEAVVESESDLLIFNFPMLNTHAREVQLKNAQAIVGKPVVMCARRPDDDWSAVEAITCKDIPVRLPGLIRLKVSTLIDSDGRMKRVFDYSVRDDPSFPVGTEWFFVLPTGFIKESSNYDIFKDGKTIACREIQRQV